MAKNKSVILMVIFLSMVLILGGCNRSDKESIASKKYPTKPITIIVSYAAGGSADVVARALEKSAVKHLGQSLVVVNMPGGAATIGMNELAGAKPDGYTIGIVGSGVVLQPLYGQTRYHYPTALEPLVKVATTPNVIASLSGKWENLSELVNFAIEHPREIKFGHSGLGSGPHLTGEMFAREAKINIVQVPFKGESESLAALLGGHVQFVVVAPSTVKEHVLNGTIKVLGVADEKRLTIPGFETVPTFKEQGIDLVFDSFGHGIAAPKGLPAAEKARLTEGLKEMINDPEFRNNMADIGREVEYLGPEEYSAKWIEYNEELTKIVKETGIVDLIASQKK